MDQASALAADFEWFPHRIDVGRGLLHLVRLTREDHRTASFISDEYIGDGRGRRSLPLAEVAAAAAAAPAGRCHFIFHSAFCCSTLLARAVDVEGKAMGLKEPYAFADLSDAALAGGSTERVRAALDPLLRLLARPFAEGETTVVKPSNVANPLIEPMLSLRQEARALFLYSLLPDYLRSIAKKGLWGRSWARNLFASLNRKPEFDAGFTEAQRWAQTDLQVAAMAWLQQQAQFARVLREQPSGRIATLDSVTLLADPARTMAAVSGLFELGLTSAQIESIAGGPIFASDSKRHDKAFDAAARADEHARVEAAHGEEIAMVVRWAEAVAAHVGVPLRLDAPLLS
jgi:hypothetical protein